MNKLLTLIFTLTLCIPLRAEQKVLNVVYEKHQNTAFAPYIVRLQQADALPAMIAFVNRHITLNQPLTLRIGADDGPLYAPSINEIWVPGDFLLEIEDRFARADLVDSQTERNDVVLDVFLHTLLHEVGHAIIAQFAIPTLGKEEDAADNLATVLLLEYADNGEMVALNAADMFALEDENLDELEQADFWGEHSLDIQRYYATVCQVYGANPEDNQEMITQGELSAEKADRCIDEYDQISSDWLSILDELANTGR